MKNKSVMLLMMAFGVNASTLECKTPEINPGTYDWGFGGQTINTYQPTGNGIVQWIFICSKSQGAIKSVDVGAAKVDGITVNPKIATLDGCNNFGSGYNTVYAANFSGTGERGVVTYTQPAVKITVNALSGVNEDEIIMIDGTFENSSSQLRYTLKYTVPVRSNRYEQTMDDVILDVSTNSNGEVDIPVSINTSPLFDANINYVIMDATDDGITTTFENNSSQITLPFGRNPRIKYKISKNARIGQSKRFIDASITCP